jgi:hypothetical protein
MRAIERQGVPSRPRRPLALAALSSLLALTYTYTGCDRLRRVTIEEQNPWIRDTPCGRISLSADQFVGIHYYLVVQNLSQDTLVFLPMRLQATAGDGALGYRLQRSGKFFEAESLRLAPGGKFNYDIESQTGTIGVKADSLFSAHDMHCGLDTLTLRVSE